MYKPVWLHKLLLRLQGLPTIFLHNLLQKELDKVAKECSPDEAHPGGIPDELSSYQKYKVYSRNYYIILSAYNNVEILFLIEPSL